MDVSIIVPTYNRNKVLVDTLKSIINAIDNSHNCTVSQLIVVDQSTSHTSEVSLFLKECEENEYFIYKKEKTPNLPHARNVGLSIAKGEIVQFLDDDVVLSENFLSNLMEGYKDVNISSVVGGVTVINKEGNILLNNQSILKQTFRTILEHILGRGKPFFISNLGFVISNPNSHTEQIVDAGLGCNMSFKKSIFNSIGYFDENYIGNALREETDLFYRIKQHNGKVLFKPNVHLKHVMANTGGCRNDMNENYWQTYFYNQCYFYIKNFNFSLKRIKLILVFDCMKCRKKGMDVNKIIKDSYSCAMSKILSFNET